MVEKDKVWRLWAEFVFVNCHCYITLYLAICSSNWNLCLASLKRMAPLFAAFDRDTYEWIIPSRHKAFPNHMLQCLKEGGFTVNITGRQFHAVASMKHMRCV